MRATSVAEYVVPENGAPLVLQDGHLVAPAGRRVPIVRGIARWVSGSNYADSFGLQWSRYRRVQLDSVNGSTLTRDRFFEGTGWTVAELAGRRVLEAGCGAGRFSEVILATGAVLRSFDYSVAVDAALENVGEHERWDVCQADIFAVPFAPASFDFVFCYGVLQHTPDPRRALLNLARYVRPGGRLAVDLYAVPAGLTKLAAKYWYRPVTRRLPKKLLLRLLELYLPWWTPVDTALPYIPFIGAPLSIVVPCWNKSFLPLSPAHRREWTILDTFDALSCEYDRPGTVADVRGWLEEAGLTDIDVREGGNGVLANARAR